MECRLNFLKRTQILGSKFLKFAQISAIAFLIFSYFQPLSFLKYPKAKTCHLRGNIGILSRKLIKIKGFWQF